MKTIYKYPIEVIGRQAILLPKYAEVLCVQIDNKNGDPHIWCLVETENPLELVEFIIFGTGQEITNKEAMRYIGTFQQSVFVWHLFKKQ
jgi:hypothetical protein